MLKFHAISDVGLVRDNNEDYHLVDPEYGLIIVADGAGGHADGEIASRVAVESCYQYLTREDYLLDTTDTRKTLMDSIVFANKQLIEFKQKKMPGSDMGTTLSCVCIKDRQASFAWMGDSRIYRLNAAEAAVAQLSVDHTLYQEMLARGEVGSSFNKHVLSRMLGSNPYAQPDGDSQSVMSGDTLLVCSDGFSDLVPEFRIQETVAAYGDSLDDMAQVFVELAKGQGGRDNITVALVSLS
ncbi:MAG: PP2C family protein-serine/threonine phosphatase [Pseudohongiellaceae bacterium]|jgi:serine/threonine protein phosphatase PrpC